MPAIRSSLAMSTSWRTAAMMSAEVLLRCPRRRFGKRISLWAPPAQWTTRTISEARIVDIGDDLVDQRAHDALLQPRIGGRRRPDRLEVRGEETERRGVDGGRHRRAAS